MKYLLIIGALLFAYAGNAQHDAKAKEILDKVSAKTKTYKTIKAEFSIDRSDTKNGKSDKQKGTIAIKGTKYKLELMGTTTFCDGKTRWAYMKESKEINITEPDKNDQLVDPSKIFTIWEKGYKYKYVAEKFESGHQGYEIDLFPENLNQKLSRVTLLIDKTSLEIVKIKYVEKDGVTYNININKFTPDATVSDTEITFNKANFPGAEIIDMRE